MSGGNTGGQVFLYFVDFIVCLIQTINVIYFFLRLYAIGVFQTKNQTPLVLNVFSIFCIVSYWLGNIILLINDGIYFEQNKSGQKLQFVLLYFLGFIFYALGKLAMYLALILRLYFTFAGSSHQYSRRVYSVPIGMYVLLIVCIFFELGIYAGGDDKKLLTAQVTVLILFLLSDMALSFTLCYLYIGRLKVILRKFASIEMAGDQNLDEPVRPPSVDSSVKRFIFKNQDKPEMKNNNDNKNYVVVDPASISQLTTRITLLSTVMICSTLIVYIWYLIGLGNTFMSLNFSHAVVYDAFIASTCMILCYQCCFAYYEVLCQRCHFCFQACC